MNKVLRANCDCRQMNHNEIINEIFENRNIENIQKFLNPKIDGLLPFDHLSNIDEAFCIINDGITEEKSFLVYADTDCDGISSGAIMYRYLKNLTDNVNIYINEGKKHGVSDFDISSCKSDIVIVVDSIDEFEYYESFLKADKKLIVLDHHIIPDSVKNNHDDSLVLISSANNYENPHLSGAGVTWKFCYYLDYMYMTDYANNLIDLAACGIIGDMCDISNEENRTICALGFKNLQNTGIKAVLGSYKFNSQAISFSIAPLINAANRLNKNHLALRLLVSDDEKEIKTLVKQLKALKEEQNKIANELMTYCEKQVDNQINNKVLTFIIDELPNISVSGLLGNKLIDKYKRPVLVLKNTDSEYSGSGRGYGTEDFNSLITDTGLACLAGHENAFGITIKHDDFDDFCVAINEKMADYNFKIEEIADAQIELSQISNALIKDFKTINHISGTGFLPLSVLVTDITDYQVSSMSNGKHLKIVSGDITLIKWNFTGNYKEFDGRPLTVIGGLDSSYFGRKFTKQIIISDYKIGD